MPRPLRSREKSCESARRRARHSRSQRYRIQVKATVSLRATSLVRDLGEIGTVRDLVRIAIVLGLAAIAIAHVRVIANISHDLIVLYTD